MGAAGLLSRFGIRNKSHYYFARVLTMALLAGLFVIIVSAPAEASAPSTSPTVPSRYLDASAFGFSPEASGVENTSALQKAVDQGGTVTVTRPGTYKIAGTVLLGSNTTLRFGNGVFLKKVEEQGPFSHVFVNKGAVSRTWDEHIVLDGLQLLVNGVDVRDFKVAYGLHGQVAFFYARDVRIEHFRCLDLGKAQYGVQVCTFEDLSVHDVVIKGMKDGVHLGRGKRFTIRDGVFQTFDDAIALNGCDYSTGNPELGWVEDGVVENCRDLAAESSVGFFCRFAAGAWIDWKPGMEVQQSDTVVSEGRLYRVQAKPDGTVYKSVTQPTHAAGQKILDSIPWGVVQTDVTYSAGVRNVVFRDIFLEKDRPAFSIHFDSDRYCRAYYPGAVVPVQQGILLDHVMVLHGRTKDRPTPFMKIATPVDAVSIVNSTLRESPIVFNAKQGMSDYGRTSLTMIGCTFAFPGPVNLLENNVPGKQVDLRTLGSTVLSGDFAASVTAGEGKVTISSDLPGLTK